jgi:putative redox protein
MKKDFALVRFVGDEMFVGVTPSGHAQLLESNTEQNRAATPMELLLIAVGSCTAIDVEAILRKKRLKLTDYRVEIRGERAADHPRKWTRIHIHHIVSGAAIPEAAVARAVELSETKYCSVAASLRPSVEIVSTFEINETKVNAETSV